MRKVTGILLCLLVIAVCAVALGDVPIDEEHFPDPAFRKYVRQFDTDGNGGFSDDAIGSVDRINIEMWQVDGLKDLTGLCYFSSLKWLACNYQDLEELDVSQNSKLESIQCYNNRIRNLDVSQNKELVFLSCNDNQIESIDVSQNTNLRQSPPGD